jgi:hypothetical protein
VKGTRRIIRRRRRREMQRRAVPEAVWRAKRVCGRGAKLGERRREEGQEKDEMGRAMQTESRRDSTGTRVGGA